MRPKPPHESPSVPAAHIIHVRERGQPRPATVREREALAVPAE